MSVTSIVSCAVRDEFRNLMLSVSSIEIFVLCVASIIILSHLASVEILLWSVTNEESCVV